MAEKPTQAEEILMDLFEAKNAYEKFVQFLVHDPPLEWPDIAEGYPLIRRLKDAYSDACASGYAYTRKWRKSDG
jgi:hypothetical protein